MEWVNITAKSLPEAIDLALDNLGVDEAEAEIIVLEEPKQGLFGRTRGNARVKARVKPKATRPKVERGRNRKRRGEDGSKRSGSGGNRGKGQSDGRRRGGGGGRSGGGSGGGRDDGDRGGEQKSEVAAKGPRTENKQSSKKDGGRDEGRRDRQPKKRNDQAPVEEASMEEVTNHLETFLSGLTEAFGFDGAVSILDDDDDGVIAMVDGKYGLMVGPKARTLDAIQELARVSAQRTAPSSIRIKVDVGGYRQMRKEALQKFAIGAAESAKVDGKERSLEPMTSADRKIVHDALSELDDIETRSAGSEPRRRVVVVPLSSDTSSDVDDDDADDEEVEEVASSADNGADSGADSEAVGS